MNQLTPDMAEGYCCQLCNKFFEKPDRTDVDKQLSQATPYTHGRPVVCWDCWDDLLSEEQEDYVRADIAI